MEELVSYQLDKWPFQEYHYVSDLIEFEGPILVHYQNQNKHAFYYWVEGNDKVNRWLCFNVALSEFYKYVRRNISLFELITSKQNEPFYTTDIDADLTYTNFQLLLHDKIPAIYLPDANSYFLEEIDPFYDELFLKQVEYQDYTEKIGQRALDLVIEPTSHSHGNTVGLSDCVEFLKNINNSYRSYGAYDFFQRFKNVITSEESMSQAWTKMSLNIDPRITYAATNSFHISLSTDVIVEKMDSVKLSEYSDFRRELPMRYQLEVLQADLNNSSKIEELLEKYDDLSRRHIFGPLIKLINRPTTSFKFIDKDNNISKQFSKVNFKNRNKLLPHKIPKEDDTPEVLKTVFLTITLEVPENTKVETISKKDILQTTLFSSTKDYTEREMQKIQGDTLSVVFNQPIKIRYRKLRDGQSEVLFEPLKISAKDFSSSIAYDSFIDQFINIIRRDFLSTTPLSKENNEYLESIIEDIQEIELPNDDLIF